MGADLNSGYDPNDPNGKKLDDAAIGINDNADPNAKFKKNKNPDPVDVAHWNAAQYGVGVAKNANISSLDKKDFLDNVNYALANNEKLHTGGLAGDIDTAGITIAGAGQELNNAIANPNAPKYRYRKYLDTITQMQGDQPGQMQTVLSRGTNGLGSALGGGLL